MSKYRGPLISYGKSETINIDGTDYYCASQAEKMWLEMVAPGLVTGSVLKLLWQPDSFPLTYRYNRRECSDTYRPDAIVTWPDGTEWVIEIKRGALHQKAASRMKRFCQQYPDRKLVIVWFGSIPKKGVAFRRLKMLEPWIDHIWSIKK